MRKSVFNTFLVAVILLVISAPSFAQNTQNKMVVATCGTLPAGVTYNAKTIKYGTVDVNGIECTPPANITGNVSITGASTSGIYVWTGSVWTQALGDATNGMKVQLSGTNTVTANAGTNLNTSALALETGGNLASAVTTLGATSDAAATAGGTGSISAKLRELSAQHPTALGAGGGMKIDGSGTALPVTGTITAVTSLTNALPAGTNVIGHVITDTNSVVAATGNAASGGADSGNPIKTGGRYNSTPPTLTDSQRGDTQLDTRGNTKSSICDSAGNARCANVNSSNQFSVSVDNNVSLATGANNIGVFGYAQGSTTAAQVGPLTQGAVTTSSPVYTNNQTSPLSMDTSGGLRVSVISGSTGNAAASNTGSAVPAQGDYVAGNVSGTLRGLTATNVSGSTYALDVNVAGGSAANGAASNTGSAVPAQAGYNGLNVAGTLRGQTGVNPTGTVYAGQGDITSVAGTTTVTAGVSGLLAIGGGAASGTSKSGNPVLQGGVFNTTQPTVTTGQAVEAQSTARGAQIVATGVDTFTATVTQGTATNLKAAADLYLAGTAVSASNPVFTRASDGTSAITDAAIGAALSSNPIPVACHNETTPTTIGNTQAGVPECDTSQRLITVGAGTAGTAAGGVMTIQGVASMTKLLVTPDSVALPANQSVNVAQVNGVTTLMGNGVTGTGSQRVTIASDNTAFAVNSTLSAETTKVIGTIRNVGNVGGVFDAIGQNVAAPANWLQTGCQFNTSPTTITSTNGSPIECDNAGNQLVSLAKVAGTTIDTNSGSKSGGTIRVVLATDQPQLTAKLLVTPDANSAVNVAQINGVTTLMGNGVTGTGSQRVTIASDNTAFTVNSVGTLANNGAAAGTNRMATLPGIARANFPSAYTSLRDAGLNTDLQGNLLVAPVQQTSITSFVASKVGLATVATPTDIAVLSGNATNTVIVNRVMMSCTQTTAGIIDVRLLKRTTADSGGTSTNSPAAYGLDSNNASAVSAVLTYTANPTVNDGTDRIVDSAKIAALAPATASPNDVYIWAPPVGSQGLILRGTAQQAALNLNSVTLSGGSCDISYTWTETTGL